MTEQSTHTRHFQIENSSSLFGDYYCHRESLFQNTVHDVLTNMFHLREKFGLVTINNELLTRFLNGSVSAEQVLLQLDLEDPEVPYLIHNLTALQRSRNEITEDISIRESVIHGLLFKIAALNTDITTYELREQTVPDTLEMEIQIYNESLDLLKQKKPNQMIRNDILVYQKDSDWLRVDFEVYQRYIKDKGFTNIFPFNFEEFQQFESNRGRS